MLRIIIIAVVCVLAAGIFYISSRVKNNLPDDLGMERTSFSVAENIPAEKFKEFYYTYSSTSNPPEFQRYRFYSESGKYMFYHEKREGKDVFLTEENITVHGTRELSQDEWNAFWNFMRRGNIQARSDDNTTGGSGPWLFLYLSGDFGEYQEFHFNEAGTLLSFEDFCESLK